MTAPRWLLLALAVAVAARVACARERGPRRGWRYQCW